MWYVLLKRPLPGVGPTVFVFASEGEAMEFQSCLVSTFDDLAHIGPVESECGQVGEANEVFPEWSF